MRPFWNSIQHKNFVMLSTERYKIVQSIRNRHKNFNRSSEINIFVGCVNLIKRAKLESRISKIEENKNSFKYICQNLIFGIDHSSNWFYLINRNLIINIELKNPSFCVFYTFFFFNSIKNVDVCRIVSGLNEVVQQTYHVRFRSSLEPPSWFVDSKHSPSFRWSLQQ